MLKRIYLKLRLIFILALFLVTLTGCENKTETNEISNNESIETLTGWGEIYYEYFIQNSNNNMAIPQQIEDGTLQFIQLKENENPILIAKYKKDNIPTLRIYYISKASNNTVIQTGFEGTATPELVYTVELLYNRKKGEYRWYVHEIDDRVHNYSDIIRHIEVNEKGVEHNYDSEYYKSEEYKSFLEEEKYSYIFSEYLNTGENSMPAFNQNFKKVDNVIQSEQVHLESFLNQEKLKESIIKAVQGYKTKDETFENLNEQLDEIAGNQVDKLQVGNYTLSYGTYIGYVNYYDIDFNENEKMTYKIERDGTFTVIDGEGRTTTTRYSVNGEEFNPEYEGYPIEVIGDNTLKCMTSGGEFTITYQGY